MKKIQDELNTLYSKTSGDRRVQLLSERLTKEINEEYKLEAELLTSRLSCESSTQEYERLKQDCASEKSLKQKAENLCNDLQNKHKQIVEDANKGTDDERQKRIALTQDYQNELTERQRKLEEVCYQRAEYTKYNELLKEKMTELLGFVEERDKNFSSLLDEKNKEIEEFKLKAEEKPSDEEEKLKEELEEYKKKFEDFQNSLTQSNVQFANFKKDMEGKTKLVKKLQKENQQLKAKENEFGQSLPTLREEVEILKESVKKHESDISKALELKKKLSGE